MKTAHITLATNAINNPRAYMAYWATLTMLKSTEHEEVASLASLALGSVLTYHLLRLQTVSILTLDDRAILKVVAQHGTKIQRTFATRITKQCQAIGKKIILKCLTA